MERDSVARAFARHGGAVHRIDRFWDPPMFDRSTVRVYGADSFCLVLQQKLGLSMCSPDDDLLLHVPSAFLQRRMSRHTLGDIATVTLPSFIKPLTPKQFRGAAYQSNAELEAECLGLSPRTGILVSEAATLTAEARTFVLDGRVLDAAVYEGEADALAAATCVGRVDEGHVVAAHRRSGRRAHRGSRLGIVEFNAPWGAGLNGCDADKVLPAIVAASSG